MITLETNLDKKPFENTLPLQRAMVPTGDISIRAAMAEDVPRILELIHGLAVYEDLERLMTATEESLRLWLFGHDPVAEVILAFCAEDCVGFALFFRTFCSVLGKPGLFLDNLYVREAWRGMGIGEALLSRLAQIAEERGAARLEWMVMNSNEPAIGFYSVLGAEFMTDWTKCRLDEGGISTLNRKKQLNEEIRHALRHDTNAGRSASR
jgi:GNAT superfamily N-acetyltransferase